MFMNDYDIEVALATFTRATCPNLLALTMVVEHLADWTNENSDGWAYWAKPRNAAQNAMVEIDGGLRRHRSFGRVDRVDITDAEMVAAVKPIKAFLTRQKVSAERREIILRSVTS